MVDTSIGNLLIEVKLIIISQQNTYSSSTKSQWNFTIKGENIIYAKTKKLKQCQRNSYTISWVPVVNGTNDKGKTKTQKQDELNLDYTLVVTMKLISLIDCIIIVRVHLWWQALLSRNVLM